MLPARQGERGAAEVVVVSAVDLPAIHTALRRFARVVTLPAWASLADAVAAHGAQVVLVPYQGTSTEEDVRAAKAAHRDLRVILVIDRGDGHRVPHHPWGLADRLLARPIDPDELLLTVATCVTAPAPPQQPAPILFLSLNGRDAPAADRVLARGGFKSVMADTEEAARECLRRMPEIPLLVVDTESDDIDWSHFAQEVHPRGGCEILALVPATLPKESQTVLRHRTSDFVFRPLNSEELLERTRRLVERHRRRHPAGVSASKAAWLRTRNSRMQDVLDALERIADTDSTVLLRGETGTGKEVMARCLHAWSSRRGGPFLALNCGAVQESLLDSELFGHERGAFTGAVKRKRGLVELAEGGTLLLDEVGELSAAMQVKLLRLLEQREFIRVGGEEVLRCDVRVLAATHRDLEAMTASGEFRKDLYYRLNVLPLEVPPLRERVEDIPELAEFILERLAAFHHTRAVDLAPEAVASLVDYKWPGNLRELENILERALLLGNGSVIRALDLPRADCEREEPSLQAKHTSLERNYLAALLTRYEGNVTAAATAAAVSRRTLYRHLRVVNLDPKKFRH